MVCKSLELILEINLESFKKHARKCLGCCESILMGKFVGNLQQENTDRKADRKDCAMDIATGYFCDS